MIQSFSGENSDLMNKKIWDTPVFQKGHEVNSLFNDICVCICVQITGAEHWKHFDFIIEEINYSIYCTYW